MHCFWVRLYYECNVVRPSSFFTYIMLEYSRCLKYYLVKIDNRIVFEKCRELQGESDEIQTADIYEALSENDKKYVCQ